MAVPLTFPVPAPRHGGVFVDPRDPARALRVNWHPESATMVVSLWRGPDCVATHHLASHDLLAFVRSVLMAVPEEFADTSGVTDDDGGATEADPPALRAVRSVSGS